MVQICWMGGNTHKRIEKLTEITLYALCTILHMARPIRSVIVNLACKILLKAILAYRDSGFYRPRLSEYGGPELNFNQEQINQNIRVTIIVICYMPHVGFYQLWRSYMHDPRQIGWSDISRGMVRCNSKGGEGDEVKVEVGMGSSLRQLTTMV